MVSVLRDWHSARGEVLVSDGVCATHNVSQELLRAVRNDV